MYELAERIRSVDIDTIFNKAINAKKDLLLDLIRKQLLSGERSDGTPIGTYSKSKLGQYYVELKFEKGLFQGGSYPNYDLYFSGEYHDSLIVEISGDVIIIKSTDTKQDEIELNTGNLDNALVLNEENMQIFQSEILLIIQKEINGSLGI